MQGGFVTWSLFQLVVSAKSNVQQSQSAGYRRNEDAIAMRINYLHYPTKKTSLDLNLSRLSLGLLGGGSTLPEAVLESSVDILEVGHSAGTAVFGRGM